MYQRLQQCAKIPDFNNYLAFILTQGEGTQDEIRQTAGLLLKNNLKTGWQSTEPAHQAYIQRALLPALGHPNRFLRHTVGTALSMITRAVGPQGWPGLYTTLAQILEQPPDAHHVDGALDCVYKACEELNGRLDEQVQGMPEGSAAGLLISRLLPLMANPDVGIRRTALGSVNLMVPSWPNTHAAAMDAYLQGLFQLANDGDNGVRKHVCSGIVSLLYRAPEKLVPNIRDVITYMIEMTNFGDEDVALESCEFWAAFCEADLDRDTVEVLREFTPKLIPMLLTNMAYAEDDEEVLNAEDDEANAGRADRDQDIKPSFRGQKDKGSGLGEGAGGERARRRRRRRVLRRRRRRGCAVEPSQEQRQRLGRHVQPLRRRSPSDDPPRRGAEACETPTGACASPRSSPSAPSRRVAAGVWRSTCRSSSSFSCRASTTRGRWFVPSRVGP